MLLDLVDRMLCEVLTDFSDDPTFDVGVEGVPQIRQCARWCDDDERLHLALAHKLFHRRGYALGEAVLLEVMPVGRLHSASDGRTCALEYAAWAVGTLLAGWRVFVNEDTFGLQIGKFLVAVVAQEQRLAAIADEHEWHGPGKVRRDTDSSKARIEKSRGSNRQWRKRAVVVGKDHRSRIGGGDLHRRPGRLCYPPPFILPQDRKLLPDQPHVVIATPCYGGQLTMAYVDSVLKLQAACIARAIRIDFDLRANEALITRARNYLAARFFATGASHLMFIDADIG
jgi:hypothetical protein